MLVIVAYDIADDRRRVRLHTLLLGYGTALQESVFACELTERQARELKRQVRRLVRAGPDDVRYFPLCAACAAKAEDAHGVRRPPEPDDFVV